MFGGGGPCFLFFISLFLDLLLVCITDFNGKGACYQEGVQVVNQVLHRIYLFGCIWFKYPPPSPWRNYWTVGRMS